jgi:DNA-dependent RNA polymerase auxiliary subunit epsilon
MMTQKQRERAPRRDKVYSTNAERHRAHRARKKLARESFARYAALADRLVDAIQALATAQPETFSYLSELSGNEVLEQLVVELREQRGALWDLLHALPSIREEL